MTEMNSQQYAPEAAAVPAPQAAPQVPAVQANVKSMNKHIFVWIGTWLFGSFGVDRFMRGQVGLGIVKLLFGWATLGIWPLVDWIIGLTKVYGGAFGSEEEVTFVNGKYAR